MTTTTLVPLTPNPQWVTKLWNRLTPSKDRVVGHRYFVEMASGTLKVDKLRRLLLDWYPLVEAFPMYLSMNLAKLARYRGPGREKLRNWLIMNITVEMRHARWWEDWAVGFDIDRKALREHRPCPEVEAVQDHISIMSDRGDVFEALGAANIAMEWPTSEWTRAVTEGVRTYGGQGLAKIDDRTMRWLVEHARYDDKHPYEAMELIKSTTTCAEDRERAALAAERVLDLFERGLTASYALG